MCNRLRRMRSGFPRYIHVAILKPIISLAHDLPKFWIRAFLASTENRRMRPRRLPDPRPVPEAVHEPICIHKK